MQVAYPNLAGEIAKRGIKKTAIATHLNISYRSLYNKLSGDVSFTWEEICKINERFFPDMNKDVLFKKNEAINRKERNHART